MLITNKQLIENKQRRFQVFTFNENGYREMGYGNLTIISACDYIIEVTPKCSDLLMVEYTDKNVRIITELEHKELHRRATKHEIVEFLKFINDEV